MGHRPKDKLAGEHRLGDIGQLTFYGLFMAFWLSDMFLGYSNSLNAYIPSAIRLPLGVLLLVVAGAMAASGMMIVYGKKNRPQGVIRKGVFRFVRHPIYVSEIIMYTGLLTLHISLAATLVFVIAIFFLYHISRCEEKLLLAKFGDEYRRYMEDVPMGFPRPKPSWAAVK